MTIVNLLSLLCNLHPCVKFGLDCKEDIEKYTPTNTRFFSTGNQQNFIEWFVGVGFTKNLC